MCKFPWYLMQSFYRLRSSERGLRDELDAARISAQTRENELLSEIQSLRSNQQAVLEAVRHIFKVLSNSGLIFECFQGNGVYNLLEPDNGEISMELATPLLPTRVMLDMNNPLSLLAPYLDPLSIPLPPSPDDHPSSSSPTPSLIILSDSNAHHERPD